MESILSNIAVSATRLIMEGGQWIYRKSVSDDGTPCFNDINNSDANTTINCVADINNTIDVNGTSVTTNITEAISTDSNITEVISTDSNITEAALQILNTLSSFC